MNPEELLCDYIVELHTSEESKPRCGVSQIDDFDGMKDALDRLVTEPEVFNMYFNYNDGTQLISDYCYKSAQTIYDSFAFENPRNSRESSTLEQYKKFSNDQFIEKWPSLKLALQKYYDKQEVDVDFYEDAFKDKNCISKYRKQLLEDWAKSYKKDLAERQREYVNQSYEQLKNELQDKITDYIQAIKESADDIAPLLAWGASPGKWRRGEIQVYIDFSQNSTIQNIVSELGRKRKVGKEQVELMIDKKNRTLFRHASKSDIDGICESDDLGALLPSELCTLSSATADHIFYRKFAEKRLQTFRYQSSCDTSKRLTTTHQKFSYEKQGPYIICLDTSASMKDSDKIAKSICYALIRESQKQNRACYLIFFSVGVKALEISDCNRNAHKITDFMSHSFSGGTDMTETTWRALDMLTESHYQSADVMFISDFLADDFPKGAPINRAIKNAKTFGTKFHALIFRQFVNTSNIIKHFDVLWVYTEDNGIVRL